MKKFIIGFFLVLLLCSIYGCSLDINKNSKNLTSYTACMEYDDISHILNGELCVNYINKSNTILQNIKFNIFANAFRENSSQDVISLSKRAECYYNGISYGNISINSVYDNDNQLKYEICGKDENILNVFLNENLEPEHNVEFTINFSCLIPNISHRFGYGENTINFGNFLPTACVFENGMFKEIEYNSNGDPFYSEVANYYITFSFNKKFTLASTGTSEEIVSANSNLKTEQITAVAVRDFAMVLSDKFSLASQSIGNTKINYFYYDDTNFESNLQTAVDAVKTFNKLFGEYPYPELDIVKSNFCIGGMEFPNLVLISDLIGDLKTYQMVIVHEIAHQWWYGLVGNNQTDYAWLDEGLAEFSTALFYKYNTAYPLTYEQLINRAKNSIQIYQKVYTDVLGTVNTSMNRSLSDFKTENEYIYTAYVKGFLLFDSLSDFLSEKVVIKCLKNYLTTYAFDIATPQLLIASFENTTSCNLESFFNTWINDKVVFVE